MYGKFPHITVHEDHVNYIDRVINPDGIWVWMATFELVYQTYLETRLFHCKKRWVSERQILAVNERVLDTAEDYKKLLIDLGYYE